jgi:hypothetical protein
MIIGQLPMDRHRFAADIDNEDGTTTRGAGATLEFTGAFQPANGNDLKVLKEGDRTGSFFVILTYTPLRSANQKTNEPSDEVTVHDEIAGTSERYKVMATKPQSAIIRHTWALVAKLDEAAP